MNCWLSTGTSDSYCGTGKIALKEKWTLSKN